MVIITVFCAVIGEWPKYLEFILTIEHRATLFKHYSDLHERNLISEKLYPQLLNMEVRRIKTQSYCNKISYLIPLC
jgi:hypothetical protein